MTYHGMGQSPSAAASGAINVPIARDWASIERFARDAAGPAFGLFERAASRVRRRVGHTAALVSLSETIAVRPLATKWLSKPAQMHRDGLLEIADFARSSARRVPPGAPNTTSAPGRPGTIARPVVTVPGRADRNVTADRHASSALVAAVRAELAKPPSTWHRDMAPMVQLADRAVADRGALREFLTRLIPAVSGDGRAALAVLVVRLEQADTARGVSSDGSSPQMLGIGNYTY